jgi:hypothetical protein
LRQSSEKKWDGRTVPCCRLIYPAIVGIFMAGEGY